MENMKINKPKRKLKKNVRYILFGISIIFIIVIVVLFINLISNDKKIICTKDSSSYGSVSQQYVFYFNSDDEIKKLIMYYDADYTDQVSDYTEEEFAKELNKQFEEKKDEYENKGIKYSYSVNGYKLNFKMNVDKDSSSKDDELKQYFNYKYDDLLENMKDSGFTCE